MSSLKKKRKGLAFLWRLARSHMCAMYLSTYSIIETKLACSNEGNVVDQERL